MLGVVFAAILMFGGALVNSMAGATNNFMGASSVLGAIVVLLITFSIALPLLGIAQVVEYIGKTAFYAELASANLSSEAYEIKKALGKISDGLKTRSEKDEKSEIKDDFPKLKRPTHSPRVPVAPVVPEVPATINCPHCSKTILESSLVNGMNVCPACEREFKVEI
jgi:hypothetical protein